MQQMPEMLQMPQMQQMPQMKQKQQMHGNVYMKQNMLEIRSQRTDKLASVLNCANRFNQVQQKKIF